MKPIYTTSLLALALFGLTSASAARAQANFGGTYTQNFSSMGSGTTAPTGWSVESEAGSHYTFAPAGSYGSGYVSPNFTAGTITTATIKYATPNDTQDGATGYNWVNTLATAQNGEGSESLGSCPSGNAATILELNLTNTTGQSISALNIGYDIDRFSTTANNNNIPAGYPNSGGVEEYPGYQLFYNLTPSNNSTWVNVSSLNPTIDAGTTGAVQVPATVGITTVSGGISLSSAWTNGSTLGLAWFDDNGEGPSPDQQIGLNAVSVAVAPEPSAVALFAAGGVVLMLLAARRLQRA